MDQRHIDALLERYLLLLDEYTQLRDRLSKLQSSVFHNIARANFAAERGLRYGQDQYDERMQALRTLKIEAGNRERAECSGETSLSFTIVDSTEVPAAATAPVAEGAESDKREPRDKGAGSNDNDEDNDDGSYEQGEFSGSKAPSSGTSDAEKSKVAQDQERREKEAAKAMAARNPLRWFGVLVPPPLRMAQNLSIEAVEQVIPRLVSVNAEMMSVEIEVRRARKKRAKAEAAATTASQVADSKSGSASKEKAGGAEALSEGISALEVS